MTSYLSAQSGTGFSSSSTQVSSFTYSLGAAISPGTSIIVIGTGFNNSNSTASGYTISDSGGVNTYSRFDFSDDTTGLSYTAGFTCLNSAGIGGGSPSITLTNSTGTFNFPAITVDVFAINGPAFDASNSAFYDDPNPGTGTNALASGAFVPTHSGDLIWGWCVDEGSFGTVSHGTGFTLGQSGVNLSYWTEYKLSGVSGSQQATFTDGTNGGRSFYQVYGLAISTTTLWQPRPVRTIYVPSYRIMRR